MAYDEKLEIEELLKPKHTDEEILIEAATELFGRSEFRSDEDNVGLIRQIGEWFDSQSKRIHEAICGNTKIREMVQNEPLKRAQLIQLILEIFVAVFDDLQVSRRFFMLIAVSLFRRGIANYCSVQWSKPNP